MTKIDEFPVVGLLFYTRRLSIKDRPVLFSEKEYEEYKSYDLMGIKKPYDEYKKSMESYIQYFDETFKNTYTISKIAIEKNNIDHCLNSIKTVESNSDFIEWYETSVPIVEHFKSL